MSPAGLISSLTTALNTGDTPEGMEYCQIGSTHWVNLIGKLSDEAISDRIFSGFDANYAVAVQKAISEKIERQAFRAGFLAGLPICQTERSDGFAALPKFLGNADITVRDNALNEALERFVWANWWDDTSIQYNHDIFEINSLPDILGPSISFVEELANGLPLQCLHLIEPAFEGFETKELLILVLEFKTGVITGGACGPKDDRSGTLLRAMSELFRHGLVLLQNPIAKNESEFYEQRLRYFASSEGLNLFHNRISRTGHRSLRLPKLKFDSEFSHPAENTHIVHRCLFEDQPAFIGGALERMCL